MTVRTRSQLNSDADTNLANNTTGDISPADVRGSVKDLADSALLPEDLPGASGKATPVDADTLPLNDSAASNALKKVTWANVKATLKTYFDTLYQPLAAALTSWAGVTRASGFDTFVATPSSANLRSLLTDEVGTGAAYFVGGALGTPASGTGTNLTGIPASALVASTSQAVGFGTVELGHASDTTLSRSAAGKLDVEGHTVLTDDEENQGPVTGGAEVTSKALNGGSAVTTGTLTLDMADRPLQHYTNGGAHTLAPGSVTGAAIIDITNNGSAGAITTSGWTKVSGSSFTTTNGHKFRCHASVGNGGSLLVVQALQ